MAKKEKYDKGRAVEYFIQQKIIEIFVLGILIVTPYFIGLFTDPFVRSLFKGSGAACESVFCFWTAGFTSLLLIGLIIGFIVVTVWKIIEWNWDLAKSRAENK